MNEQKLKSEFHKLIDTFEDTEVLESVYAAMTDMQKNRGKDILDELTEQQRKELDESLEQARRGEVIPHEVMRDKIKKWLSR